MNDQYTTQHRLYGNARGQGRNNGHQDQRQNNKGETYNELNSMTDDTASHGIKVDESGSIKIIKSAIGGNGSVFEI